MYTAGGYRFFLTPSHQEAVRRAPVPALHNAAHRSGFFKSEWMPKQGYRDLHEATRDIGFYLMSYYNRRRPHSYNAGLPPELAEKRLNKLSGNS